MVPFNQQGVVVIDDDEDVIIIEDDDEVLRGLVQEHDQSGPSGVCVIENSRFTSHTSPDSLAASADHMHHSFLEAPARSHSCSTTSARINSIFRNPNWESKSSGKRLRRPEESQVRQQSDRAQSFATSPSPTTFRDICVPMPTSPHCGSESSEADEQSMTPTSDELQRSQQSFHGQRSTRHEARRISFVMLDDDDDEIEYLWSQEMKSEPEHINDLEDLRLKDARALSKNQVPYEREESRLAQRRSPPVTRSVLRNPILAEPWGRLVKHWNGSLNITPNKVLELQDGDFARVQDIFQHMVTKEVKLRGIRLQRNSLMNGFLEKKANELTMCLEVDLDDCRDPLEQAAVDIPLSQVVKRRSARFTNQRFPLCRNFDFDEYCNLEAVKADGGMTVRWKYTRRYQTATDRHSNYPKEQVLERILETECSTGYVISGEDARFQWRGETIKGGAYKAAVKDGAADGLLGENILRPISIESTPEPQIVTLPRMSDPQMTDSIDACSPVEADNVIHIAPTICYKRKRSKTEYLVHRQESTVALMQKRPRRANNEIEETRKDFARINLEESYSYGGRISIIIDLTSEPPSSSSRPDASFIPQVIDLVNSNLIKPPDTGSIITQARLPPPIKNRNHGQKYTYGDAFCGAGGATRGAVMAGLHVKWGFDFSRHACASWKANFPHADCYPLWAHDFLEAARPNQERVKVDILHLSPPCQYFSTAHTVDGPNDEMNTASLFAVGHVLEVAKPRIATLEQTFGLTCSKFRFYFNSLLQMFTSRGYSLRWSTIALAQWGLPQSRRRLIIIASCPGEPLPPIPAPTHTKTPAPSSPLPPYVSANSILSRIPTTAPDHFPHALPPRIPPTPWDGSKILPRAMTTTGGQNCHPSGTRDLTLREYAALQGFPMEHVFCDKYRKKQIGNAVPPVCARVLFEGIRRALEDADGVNKGGNGNRACFM